MKFLFENIGTTPLVIENVSSSCGCTTAYYSVKPIVPHKTGKIIAIYNASTIGHVFKTITIKFYGIPDKMDLVISGEVKK